MLDKIKSQIHIPDQYYKWIAIVVAALLLYLAYAFGYSNFMDNYDKYNKESSKLQATHADLLVKSNNQAKYQEDTAKLKNSTDSILSSYANNLTDDGNLMFTHTMENATGAYIKSYAWSPATAVFKFGEITSTNPNGGGSVYTTDMVGISSTYTYSYEVPYEKWVPFLNYIIKYYSQVNLDSISATYNAERDIVTGSLTATAYAITGSNRVYTRPTINLPTSTPNIFKSKTFNAADFDVKGNNGDVILSDYDYYMSLNSATSDGSSVLIAKRDDTTRDSVLASSENKVEEVQIKFTGSNGIYAVSYKIGNATYPATNYAKGVNFDAGSSLDFLILSSKRLTDTDKSGAKVSFINETDKELNVKIANDDAIAPRVTVASKTGNVNIYN